MFHRFEFRMKKLLLSGVLILIAVVVMAQEKTVPIKYGDMEHWTVRYIKESRLLGGKTKTLYVPAPTDTLYKNAAFDFRSTCWGVSNAWAAPMGIDKGVTTTQPEQRGSGTCARLDTRLETVKVLGMIHLEVCIVGTLFWGRNIEPVTNANDPYGAVDMGIPFTEKPKAVILDLKMRINPEQRVLKATGFARKKWIVGHDEPEVYVFLEKRWEDAKGNIYAKRIGTARHRFSQSIPEWHNNYRVDIHYGDITGRADFKKYQGLFPDGGQFKAMNRKGKIVPIQEIGWGSPDETPTHIILVITAGCYPAFHGYPGNAIWVDNVRFLY